MRAILINPFSKNISRVYDEFGTNPALLQYYVQSDVITPVALGPNLVMFVDSKGETRKDQRWFSLKDNPAAVAGRALMINMDMESGDFHPCQFPVDALQRMIGWVSPEEAARLLPEGHVNQIPRVHVRRDGSLSPHPER